MTKLKAENSLLPFLRGGADGHGLLLDLLPRSGTDLASDYPFVVIDDSYQFSRLLEGRFITASGTEISRLILLVQKDNYAVNDDTLVTITNQDVDSSWIDVLQGNSGDIPKISLTEQIDQSSTLVRNRSLFFCRFRQCFFHPLCPSCGAALQLCTDEQLLAGCGLAPYATSLTRYLHCSSCSTTDQQFYIFERDRHSPLRVQDRWSLIERFSQIDASMAADGSFPCLDCPERHVCFGSERAVRDRILPFSFYPFQMILFSAPDLSAIDFFQLLSGASVAEITGRLDAQREVHRIAALARYSHADSNHMTLLDRHDPRFFLELLYLKIVFLANVLESSQSYSSGKGSPVKTDRVWLHLASVSAPLPASWGFTVTILPDVAPPRFSLPGRLSLEQTVAPLGLLWFQTLLQNKAIGRRELLQGVMEYLAAGNATGKERQSLLLNSLAIPENIFWQWGGPPVADEWLPLWEEACACGFRLLDAAFQGDCVAAFKGLKAEVSELSRIVLDTLLMVRGPFAATVSKSDQLSEKIIDQQSQPAFERQESQRRVDDAVIRKILLRITDKYRQELAAPVANEAIKETDRLSSPASGSDYDPEETETIVLGVPRTITEPTEKSECDLEETVILSAPTRLYGKSAETAADDEIITETVVLSQASDSRGGVILAKEVTEQILTEDQELSETVIIPQGMQRPRPGSNLK